jgi:hypothetical protein
VSRVRVHVDQVDREGGKRDQLLALPAVRRDLEPRSTGEPDAIPVAAMTDHVMSGEGARARAVRRNSSELTER